MKNIFWRFLFQNLEMHFFRGQHIFVSSFFSVLAFKTIDAQILFRSVFFKTHKKVIIYQKWQKWRFWLSIIFFSAFSNILTKRTFVRLLFLKLNQSRNMKNNFFFFTKNPLFLGSTIVVFKTQISNLFSAFAHKCKRKLPTNFHNKRY